MGRTLYPAAILAVLCGVSAAALALLPGPLYQRGLVDLATAFAMLTEYAPLAAIAAGTFGILSGGLALWRRRWGTLVAGIAALAIGVGVILSLTNLQQTAAANPLHDVTTDLNDPPQFEVLSPRRYAAGDPAAQAAFPHPDWRATHAEIYPDIETGSFALTLDQAVGRVTRTAEALGWTVESLRRTEDTARIEAVATTGWFGFSDDIVVRITDVPPDGVEIDVRSVSRIGLGDLGTNAQRLRQFFDSLEDSPDMQDAS